MQAYLSRSITILQKQESQRAVLMGGQVESVSKVIAHIEVCVRLVQCLDRKSHRDAACKTRGAAASQFDLLLHPV